MPSPFPGMDPFIGQAKIWPDFHNRLAGEISARLNDRIRPAYFARLIPHTTYEVIEIASSRTKTVRPDLGVGKTESKKKRSKAAVAVVLDEITPAPVESVALHEVLVTAIEILSPVNKQPGHEAYTDYLRKRRELMNSSAHFLEIDLLRSGQRPPLAQPIPPAPYYVTLSRANRRPVVEIWPLALEEPLPVIPVPLNPPDADVPINLSKIVAGVYERGGYDAQIDYEQPIPLPKLTLKQRRWVSELLYCDR